MAIRSFSRLAVLAAVTVLVAACSSKAERIASGLAKGEAFVRTTDWDKANVEARNVLQIDPKNAEAYYIAGQVAEGKQDIQAAYGRYLKTVELRPDHLPAKVALARIYLLARLPDKSRQTIDEVLAVAPTNVGARTIRAAQMAADGNLDGAAKLARELISAETKPPVEPSMLLAGIQRNQGANDAALATIEAALQGEPKNVALLQIAAQIASTGDRKDAAATARTVDYLSRASVQAPRNDEIWTAWATYHASRGEVDRAEDVLRRAIKATPDDSRRQLVLLDFLAQRRGFDAAEKGYLAAIADAPRSMPLRFGLAALYRSVGRTTDDHRVLEEIISRQGKESADAALAQDQLAAEALQRGRVGEAKQRLAEVLKTHPRDGGALVMRGRIMLAEGDARSAILDLRAASRDQPGSPDIAGLLARAHRLAGEPQLAREALADLVKFKPDAPDGHLLLAADMADSKEFVSAVSEVDTVIKIAPRDWRAYDMKAQIALAQQNMKGAEQVYADLKSSFPKEPVGPLKLGKLYGDARRYDAALKEYDAAARLAPEAAEPVLRAIGILIAQRRFDDANARIDAMDAGDKRNPLPHQLRGDVAYARGDRAAAEKAYRQMIAIAPSASAGYASLARVQQDNRQVDAGLATLKEGEAAVPSDTSLAAQRADWLTQLGRRAEAIAIYESLVQRQPDNEPFANNLAYLLSADKDNRAQLERALTLSKRFKDSSNPGYLDSLGWVHYRLGQYGEATEVLEKAVKQAPESLLLQLHLGMALQRAGDQARAQPYLRKALASKESFPDLAEAQTLVR